jgi:hypothetical protein
MSVFDNADYEISFEAKDLILKLLEKDPTKRLGFQNDCFYFILYYFTYYLFYFIYYLIIKNNYYDINVILFALIN